MRPFLRVGYLGPPGSFCEEACTRYLRGKKGRKAIWYSTIPDVILATQDGFLDECVVPIENALEGTVGLTTDLLAKQEQLKIAQEMILPIKHHLLVRKKTPLSKITDLISHPQAIAQCQSFIRMHLADAGLHHADSTSEAAKWISRRATRKRCYAAIGTERAAKLYGLTKLAGDMSDFEENETRFVVIGRKDHPPTGRDKTSILFTTLRDKPGALHEVLAEFANRKINLTKIESRPSKRALGDYFFFIDLEGHRETPTVRAALHAVGKRASSLKILGSYPQARS